jgi:hypothetical protein
MKAVSSTTSIRPGKRILSHNYALIHFIGSQDHRLYRIKDSSLLKR